MRENHISTSKYGAYEDTDLKNAANCHDHVLWIHIKGRYFDRPISLEMEIM